MISPEEVKTAFRSLAERVGVAWSYTENYCALSRDDSSIRVFWMIDGIKGIFPSLLSACFLGCPANGYGLHYLVEFKGGSSAEIEKAKSDDLISQLEIVQKYALPFLFWSAPESEKFAEFAGDRVRSNIEKLPQLPEIKTNKVVRAEWL